MKCKVSLQGVAKLFSYTGMSFNRLKYFLWGENNEHREQNKRKGKKQPPNQHHMFTLEHK